KHAPRVVEVKSRVNWGCWCAACPWGSRLLPPSQAPTNFLPQKPTTVPSPPASPRNGISPLPPPHPHLTPAGEDSRAAASWIHRALGLISGTSGSIGPAWSPQHRESLLLPRRNTGGRPRTSNTSTGLNFWQACSSDFFCRVGWQ
uniref:Uncharacterized protein n=1 Tax=Aegilops tauschii subsp. strangulata TaxID=200361 RepID=A0A453HRU5_AEGTS